MDFITLKLNTKIEYYKKKNDLSNLKVMYQAKLEYFLLLSMAYLWGKNLDKIPAESKEHILRKIDRPTIGDVVSICKNLDIEKEVFSNKKSNKVINEYPSFRNEKIGHGFTFEDGNEEFIQEIEEMIEQLNQNVSIFKSNFEFVYIEARRESVLEGTCYKHDGSYDYWTYHSKSEYELGSIYLMVDHNKYVKVSPFLLIKNEGDIYLFKSIKDRLTGAIEYNRLLVSEKLIEESNYFRTITIEDDLYRKRTINGTVVNRYENNYSDHHYIEINMIKKLISEFLTKDKAFVCSTIWGHGGVGKTATVQKIVEDLTMKSEREFDYIVFVSAKDRYYDQRTGELIKNDNDMSYVNIIRMVNRVMGYEESDNYDNIVNTDSRLLLIVDDYETFNQSDQREVNDLIKKLDIKKHKVLITTRSNSVIGLEIKTNELVIGDTVTFLKEAYKNIFNRKLVFDFDKESEKKLFTITSGRPIFILQFAYIAAQKGIKDTLEINLKNEKNAIDFLYGKIFNYLSEESKKVFMALGVVTDPTDLTGVIEKVKYVLNMEEDVDFELYLSSIVKLRVIELDGKFYRVYSNEIYNMMKKYYSDSGDGFRGNINQRLLQISRDRNLDNDNALLINANSIRSSKPEYEVVSAYRQILNRKNCKNEIKVEAILNLADYLYNSRGNKEIAIKTLEEYFLEFSKSSKFIRALSNYLWSVERNEESISILQAYFSNGEKLNSDQNVELFGLLLVYKSLNVIEKRDILKNKKHFGEVSESEFRDESSTQRLEMENIFNTNGNTLIQFLKIHDIEKYSSKSKQNIITAIYQFSEVCIRIQRYSEAEDLCKYALAKMSKYNYGLGFNSRIERISTYQKNGTEHSS
ncbi:NACHT domain-containing protein [Paenibacillus taichungensis]|uniref:NACHT domain-containing protein n=1 Tax=Paenibacillus taichungensis TaxID=484184 RepID=UPI0035D53083